ncbi:hypothetical protein [Plantibacter sp. M259]|uniref:hypothetical protein n=1 Tax=Plantibacter sp. M259 TaxID=2583822 RepID=UPI00143DC6D9|nr:hypothetical protein [Plantibacter sp. M259]
MTVAILAGVLALVVSLLSQLAIRPILIHRAVVDTPNHRSMHVTPTIRGEGSASRSRSPSVSVRPRSCSTACRSGSSPPCRS